MSGDEIKCVVDTDDQNASYVTRVVYHEVHLLRYRFVLAAPKGPDSEQDDRAVHLLLSFFPNQSTSSLIPGYCCLPNCKMNTVH
jgi:hypothetical protein